MGCFLNSKKLARPLVLSSSATGSIIQRENAYINGKKVWGRLLKGTMTLTGGNRSTLQQGTINISLTNFPASVTVSIALTTTTGSTTSPVTIATNTSGAGSRSITVSGLSNTSPITVNATATVSGYTGQVTASGSIPRFTATPTASFSNPRRTSASAGSATLSVSNGFPSVVYNLELSGNGSMSPRSFTTNASGSWSGTINWTGITGNGSAYENVLISNSAHPEYGSISAQTTLPAYSQPPTISNVTLSGGDTRVTVTGTNLADCNITYHPKDYLGTFNGNIETPNGTQSHTGETQIVIPNSSSGGLGSIPPYCDVIATNRTTGATATYNFRIPQSWQSTGDLDNPTVNHAISADWHIGENWAKTIVDNVNNHGFHIQNVGSCNVTTGTGQADIALYAHGYVNFNYARDYGIAIEADGPFEYHQTNSEHSGDAFPFECRFSNMFGSSFSFQTNSYQTNGGHRSSGFTKGQMIGVIPRGGKAGFQGFGEGVMTQPGHFQFDYSGGKAEFRNPRT